MGGFLSALGTLAGGFNTRRRIDEEGFDFREADRARQFERDRAEELARQADADRAADIGAEVALGTPEGEDPNFGDLARGMDQDVYRARVGGKVRSTKPYIKTLEANLKRQEGEARHGEKLELEGLKIHERDALVRLKADLDANRPPSPRDQFIADEAARRKGIGVQAMMQALQIRREDKLFPVDEYDSASNKMVRRFVGREEAATGEFPRMGTTEMNRVAASRNSLEVGNKLLGELSTPEFEAVLGPLMGRYKSIEAAVGAGDPTARYLQGAVKSLAALQPQIHGFRAIRFAEDIEKNLLQTQQTPQALAAAIQGLLQASRAVGDVDLYSFMPADFQQYAGVGEGGEEDEVESIARILAAGGGL